MDRTYRQVHGPKDFRRWEKDLTTELELRDLDGYLREDPEVIVQRKIDDQTVYLRSLNFSISQEDEQDQLGKIRCRAVVRSDNAYQAIVRSWLASILDWIPAHISETKNPFLLFNWLRDLFDTRETDKRAVLWSRLMEARTEPGQHPGPALHGVQAIIQALRATTPVDMTASQFLSAMEPIAMMETLPEEYNDSIPALLEKETALCAADVTTEAFRVWNQRDNSGAGSDYAAERLRSQAAKRKREE